MGITIEPITLIIRIGENHHKYGDTYTLVCVATIKGDVAHIKAMCGFPLDRSTYREIVRKLKDDFGITKVEYERKKKDFVKKEVLVEK